METHNSQKIPLINPCLQNLLKQEDSRIFVDTCIMMHEQFVKLLTCLIPLLHQFNKKLTIPYSCIKELEKLHNKEKTRIQAYNALMEISRIKKYVEIRSQESDTAFADNVFLRVFAEFRVKYKLILITEDKDLSNDLLMINQNKSVRGKKVFVYNMRSVFYQKEKKDPLNRSTQTSVFAKQLTTIPDTPIKLKHLPQEGDYVYNKDGLKIKLIEDFKAGGEGTVYKIGSDPHMVAKIYHKGKLTERKKAKLNALISKNLDIKGVCFPREFVYNKHNEVIGYLMPLVKGRSLDGTIFKGEKGFTRFFSNWTREDLIDLCINILTSILYLHKNGILLGDINGSNFLIVSSEEFYIVDTDSFQIDGFPCPVGKEEFTAPEIQGKNYGEFLRTEGNENFAIATLLFKMLMFGQKPYAKLECENVVKDIKAGDFSYPYKNNSNKLIPNGNWCYFWSHLHPKVKEAFYQTFKKGECKYEPDQRPTCTHWLYYLKTYKKNMHDGYLANVDEESLKLFPKTYKKIKGHTYLTCKICGRETDSIYMMDGKYCWDCIKGYTETKCTHCGKPFKYSNYTVYVKLQKVPSVCPVCIKQEIQKKREEEREKRKKLQAWRNKTHSTHYCKVCGNAFSITNGEYEYLQAKHLEVPKRCKTCIEEGRRSPNYSERDNAGHKSHNNNNNSFGCFITTAVCDYFGKPDNCTELTKLRAYRDQWLMKQENGLLDVAVYYDYAPQLVERMIKSSDYAETCQAIMKNFIYPCLELIDMGRYEECREHYFNLFQFMIKKFK